MTLLILGILLWVGAHLLKRVSPDVRKSLWDRFGNGSMGIIALILLVSVVFMVIGYRSAPVVVLYDPPSWGGYLNNLLMIVAFFLFGVGSTGSWLASRMRHPMLTAMKVWAVAHLLANGDLASVVLFGAMLAWAVVSVILINRQQGAWRKDLSVAFGGRDIALIFVWALMFAFAAWVHIWLGHNPFMGDY